MSRRRKQPRADEQPGTRPAVSLPGASNEPAGAKAAREARFKAAVLAEFTAQSEIARAIAEHDAGAPGRGADSLPPSAAAAHATIAPATDEVALLTPVNSDELVIPPELQASHAAIAAAAEALLLGDTLVHEFLAEREPSRPMTGFLATLTDEHRTAALANRDPSVDFVGARGVFLPGTWGCPAAPAPAPAPEPDTVDELRETRFSRILGAAGDVAARHGLGHEAARLYEAQQRLDEFRAKLPEAAAAMRALGMPAEFVEDLERMAAVL